MLAVKGWSRVIMVAEARVSSVNPFPVPPTHLSR